MALPLLSPMITVYCGNMPIEVARDDLETAMLTLMQGEGAPTVDMVSSLAYECGTNDRAAFLLNVARYALAQGVEPYPVTATA